MPDNPLPLLRDKITTYINNGAGHFRPEIAIIRSRVLDLMIEWIDELLPPTPKPCPFCGSTDLKVVEMFEDDYGEKSAGYGVTCRCRYIEHKTPEAAVTAWNQRAGGDDAATH